MANERFLNHLAPDGMKLIASCPVCAEPYNPIEAKVIEEKDTLHLLHIQCKSCGSAIVSVVFSDGFGVSSMGLVTDLTAEDVAGFKDASPIAADDVMEMHRLLERSA